MATFKKLEDIQSWQKARQATPLAPFLAQHPRASKL
jgi:hypothetical protein